uniref:VWFA domain-containing protein n=1 Tax=Plectus sambesii TaxID=2011161 RepID=A0A914X0K2_9BILA
MLHCGNGVCIDSSKIRDCVADCPDGSDEGSTMSTVCVSRSNLTADKDCTPIKCQNCVPPKNNTNLYANDTSVWAIYVVDVGARMSDDLKYFVEAIAKHLPAVESQFPGHISDFIVVPVGDSHAPGVNLPFNSSAIDQLEDGLAQQLKSGDECQKSLMQGILSGLKLAPPGSVLTVITDSSAYDSDLSADVIKLAVDRMVQIYVILSDDSCTCICTAQNVDQKTIAAFKNIVMVTHGSLYEITKTADDYNRAIAATTLSLRPDAVLIGKITNMTSASISVPLDSGMDSIIPEAVGASLQWSTMVGSTVFFGTKILNMTSAQSIITPLIYPGYPLTVSGTANGEIIINVRSLAWPATLATLSPNPQATQPTTTNAPAFGVPYYLLSGFSHSQQTKVTIERMDMIECASGKVLWTGMPAAYSNPSLPDYTMMIGPIDAPCRHFDIVLYGKNVGGESVARIAKHAFVVSDRTNEVVHGFPGSCPLLGQFDCGDGTCVDEAKFRDCAVDCPNTNDEARFKQQCSSQDFFVNGSKAECVPIKCPNCLPPNGTDLYGENPPVSASYVIDIGARGVVIFDALTNATHRVFPAFDRKFPLRISKYELITISRATDRDFPAVESSTAEQFASDISELETISDGSTECNRRVLSAIQQAVDSADPGGVISVFVASGDSVLTSNNSDLVNRIIDTAAVQKRLTINIALTDKDCVCICTASNNTKNDATVLALKKIAQMTRGIFVGSAFDPTVIDGIVALTARDLRPDAIELAGSSTQSGAASVTIPVDSGLNTVTALANGVGVVIDFSGDNVSPSNKIVDTSDSVAESVSALTPGPGKTITIDAFAIGPVVLSVGAVGWPSVDVIFTLDPKSANPALTTSPLYGSRFHVLAAHSNDDKTTWPIESIEIVDAETGKTIRRGDAINLEPSIPGYSVSAGPFLAPCSYFFVTVGGTNPAGEQWKRMVKATFMAQDNYSGLFTLLNNTVCPTGKFSCESGSTTCLDQSKIQDCNVDCASGIDEARSKADILFCQSSQSPDATCQPTKCTQSCDPTTNTTENIYGKEPPISAVFVVDTGTRMTDDIPLISSSLQSKLPQVTSEFPGRISSYILFPIGKEPTTSTNFDGFSSALNALSLSGSDCQRPTYQTITTAISMALPNSVMILFTDSGITDAANEKQVIDAALDKNIQINVFLTDTACACICSANDKDQQSIDSLKKLAKLTKGSFVEMPPTQANYQAAAAIASNSLRPDSVILADIASSTGISQEIALDSNLKQVTAVLNSDRTVHTGEGTITTS